MGDPSFGMNCIERRSKSTMRNKNGMESLARLSIVTRNQVAAASGGEEIEPDIRSSHFQPAKVNPYRSSLASIDHNNNNQS